MPNNSNSPADIQPTSIGVMHVHCVRRTRQSVGETSTVRKKRIPHSIYDAFCSRSSMRTSLDICYHATTQYHTTTNPNNNNDGLTILRCHTGCRTCPGPIPCLRPPTPTPTGDEHPTCRAPPPPCGRCNDRGLNSTGACCSIPDIIPRNASRRRDYRLEECQVKELL